MVASRRFTLRSVSSVVGSLAAIVGAVLFVDARYAHSDSLAELQKSQIALFKRNRDEMKFAGDMLRKQLLEDKVFEMNMVPERKRSDVVRALLDRYRAQIREINLRWPLTEGLENT